MKYFNLLLKNDPSVYEKYFSGIFNRALQAMNDGKVNKAERILNNGSKTFFRFVKKRKSISAITIDSCSAYLLRYYQKNGNTKKLNEILNRNFIYYNGEFYSINIKDDTVARIMTIEEEPTCDCAFEIIPDNELADKLREVNAL